MSAESQVNLFDVSIPPLSPAPILSAADSIGCCSRYLECAGAGYCLIKDEEHCKRLSLIPKESWPDMIELSSRCFYRKNLEAGHIFCGKNANAFNQSKFADLCQRVNALNPDVRSVFDSILIDFSEYHRSAPRCIVRNKYISELSAVGLFEFRPMGAEFTKLCSHRSFLKPAVMSHPEYGPLFRQAQADRGRDKHNRQVPKASSKEFLLYWLDRDGLPLRDLLANPYRFAFLPPENILYAEELYRDTLFSGYEDRIYPLSPFAEDGLLSPAVFEEEESRRLKLSRGYSQAEKEQRIEAIHDLSATYSGSNLDRYNPFWGKTCVVTGSLSRMERPAVLSEIRRCGGRVSDTPVNSMDILILGDQEWSAMNGGVASRKVQKAADLQKSGKDVKIISEDEFYSMLEKIPL